MGGFDKEKFAGDLDYVPLTNESYWQVSLEAMEFGDTTIVRTPPGMKAIVDSGTSLLAGPKDLVDQMAQKAGATSVMAVAAGWPRPRALCEQTSERATFVRAVPRGAAESGAG